MKAKIANAASKKITLVIIITALQCLAHGPWAAAATSADERDRRLKAYGEWAEEEARIKAARQPEQGEVKIAHDPDSKAVLVEAVLNGDAKVVFTLDTGADTVLLSRRVGDELGLDMSTDAGKNVADLRLAGGKTTKAKMVVLKSVNIQGVEEKDVLAAVLFDDSGYTGFKDGLLGRTFLSRFNMSLDFEKMTMTLKKLK